MEDSSNQGFFILNVDMDGRINQNISNNSNLIDKHEISFTSGKVNKKNTRVKPKFFKLLGQIMNNHIDVK